MRCYANATWYALAKGFALDIPEVTAGGTMNSFFDHHRDRVRFH